MYKLSFRRAAVQSERVAVLGLFLEFLLSVEFMEPGQLSISLYSVCKISDLNTEPLSVDVELFFFKYYFLCSVRIMYVCYVLGVFFFSGLGEKRMVFTTDANTKAQRGCV